MTKWESSALALVFLFLGHARAERPSGDRGVPNIRAGAKDSCEATKYPTAKNLSYLLWLAVYNEDFSCLKEALARGADPSDDVNALAFLYNRNIKIAKILLQNGAHLPRPSRNVGEFSRPVHRLNDPWLTAVRAKNVPLLRYYLSLTHLDPQEQTALFSAITDEPYFAEKEEMLELVAGWPNAIEKEREKKIDRAWKDWETWSRFGWIPQKYWPDPKKEFLIEVLTKSFEANKTVHAPFKDATPRLRAVYHHLNRAIKTPETLRASSLNINGVSTPYYRLILQGAMTPQAQASGLFKPDKNQALKVAKVMITNEDAREDDLKASEWLLGKAGISIAPSLHNSLALPVRQTKGQILLLLGTNPMKFKSAPNIMALKFTKVMLDSSSKNYRPALVDWFLKYGDLPDANKAIFFSLARLIVEKAPLREQDRRTMLKAMIEWAKIHPNLRHEIAILLSGKFGTISIHERSLQDTALIAQEIGLRSELSFPAWLAQIRAFGELRARHKGAALQGSLSLSKDDLEIVAGLLKYSLGQPDGVLEVRQYEDHTKQLQNTWKIKSSEPRKGSIVKLCRIIKTNNLENLGGANEENAALIESVNLWLKTLRDNLDKPRIWPDGFERAGTSQSPTLREEFKLQELKNDLKALESNCDSVPARKNADEANTAKEKPPALQKPRIPTKTKNDEVPDFNPTGRRRRIR